MGTLGIGGSPNLDYFDLFEKALTHSSAGSENYERLEFLGDAVLKLVVSSWLFHDYPHLPEGKLTQIRAKVVSDRCLAEVAERIELGDHLIMGPAERRSGGEKKVGTLASALEALFAAVYLREGMGMATRLIKSLLREELEETALRPGEENSKALLQEWTQARHSLLPEYRQVKEEGPIHARVFFVEVWLLDQLLGKGEGASKKAAEQAAAREALTFLEEKR
ncbi:MAG TPA: ribonuclease III [Chroococcales cyanobacterium]